MEVGRKVEMEVEMKVMEIPWAKLYIDEQEMQEVIRCVKSTWLAKGPKVEQFEQKVKSLLGIKHCIAINNGTSALDVALKVLDIQPGDEVIVPAMAYIATVNSVLYQQAIPVFADIRQDTFTLDPQDVVRKITPKTRAIIPIDYAGQAADYEGLRRVITEKNTFEKNISEKKIFLVEDAAPSFGGESQGKKCGALGDIAITSFHTAKSFSAVEGGMVFTENDAWAAKARIILNQGESPDQKYFHPHLGHNYRMSDLHASIGLVQVSRFREVLAKRAAIAAAYTAGLSPTPAITVPHVLLGNTHSWFLYPTLVPQRDKVVQELKKRGITTNVSWPMPAYKQPFLQKYFRNTCPVAEDITQRILCLPIYYAMTEEEQRYVMENLKDVVNKL